jgi:hypothetical protein
MHVLSRSVPFLFYAVYFLLSLFALAHFLNVSWLGDRGRASYHFDAIYEGTADKPFVYRVLMPSLTRSFVWLAPIEWEKDVDRSIKAWAKNASVRSYAPWIEHVFPDKSPALPRLIAIALIYAGLLGYAAVMYVWAAKLFPDDYAIRFFAPVFALISIQAFSWPRQFPYDISVLFLSAASYYCMTVRSFRWYVVWFILACFNKETAIFILLFFALWFYQKLDRGSYLRALVWQGLVYVGIRIVLVSQYADNPDWFDSHSYFAPMLKDMLGRGTFDRAINIAMLFFLFTYRWQEKPAFLKTGLWTFSAMYIAYLVHGHPGEYRVFFDVLPPLVLLSTHTLIAAAGIGQSSFFRGRAAAGSDEPLA